MSVWLACIALLAGLYTTTPSPGNRFTLEVEKTGLMKGKKHVFSFPKYNAQLQYDPSAVTSAKVEFTLDGASMVCEDEWVKPKDKEKILEWGLHKMIEVEKHPQLRFVSGKVTETDAGHFQVGGNLSIRDVERPVTIAVTKSQANGDLILEGQSTIDMRDWGMKPPTAGLGSVGTKPEMLVRFHLRFQPSAKLARDLH